MNFLPKGITNVILPIHVQNLASSNAGGLTGISSSSPNINCYYHRDVDPAPTQIPLRNMSVGTYLASGLTSVSDSIAPGDYQLCPPNACFANGANFVTLSLTGVTDMLPVKLVFYLTDAAPGYIATSGIQRSSFASVSELSTPPASTTNNPLDMVNWMFMRSKNKSLTTSNASGSGGQDIIYRSDGVTVAGSSIYSDTSSAFTRDNYL